MTPERRAYQTEWIRRYRAKNPEKVRASARASMKKWAAKNPETHRAKVKEWRQSNPDKLKVLRKNHKAKRQAIVGRITNDEWLDRLAEFNSYCAYCIKPVKDPDMEHMQPTSRSGLNTIDNVVPSCSGCNSRKHTKNLLEFARVVTAI